MTRREIKLAKSEFPLLLMFNRCIWEVEEKCSEYGLTFLEYGKFYFENLEEALTLENKYNRVIEEVQVKHDEFDHNVIYRIKLKKL
jgi:hypothetical protein